MISTTLRHVLPTILLTLALAVGAATGVAAAAPRSDPGGGEVRPANGEVVLTRDGRGPGRVEIEGGPTDAVLTLARGDRAVRSIYVRAGGHAAVDGIPDGSYTVFVTSGHDWDDATRRFARDATYERWPGESGFTTRDVHDGTDYTIWTYTLTETAAGNITPEPVAEDGFPR